MILCRAAGMGSPAPSMSSKPWYDLVSPELLPTRQVDPLWWGTCHSLLSSPQGMFVNPEGTQAEA